MYRQRELLDLKNDSMYEDTDFSKMDEIMVWFSKVVCLTAFGILESLALEETSPDMTLLKVNNINYRQIQRNIKDFKRSVYSMNQCLDYVIE